MSGKLHYISSISEVRNITSEGDHVCQKMNITHYCRPNCSQTILHQDYTTAIIALNVVREQLKIILRSTRFPYILI